MDTATKQAIANHLSVKPEVIASITELKWVWCVVVRGRRGRFVSKKIINGYRSLKTIEPLVWVLEAKTRRQEYAKKWLARICGTSKEYTFERQFIEPRSTKWGKKGIIEAEFEIDSPGFYQDSEGDYFRVFQGEDGEFDAQIVPFGQVRTAFYSTASKT